MAIAVVTMHGDFDNGALPARTARTRNQIKRCEGGQQIMTIAMLVIVTMLVMCPRDTMWTSSEHHLDNTETP
eukprot:3740401-Pyramimonas_sp.AAC.1